jgi:hypothetical protein
MHTPRDGYEVLTCKSRVCEFLGYWKFGFYIFFLYFLVESKKSPPVPLPEPINNGCGKLK